MQNQWLMIFELVHKTFWTAICCRWFSIHYSLYLLKIMSNLIIFKFQIWTFCCFIQIRDACSEVEEDECVLQPRKRPRCHSGDSPSTVTTSEKCSLSPHIGELFVYLDQSVRNEGILGITVERTLVCTCSTFKHHWTLSVRCNQTVIKLLFVC